MPENVTSDFGYIRFIKSKNQPVLTDTEVNDITNMIENGRLVPSFKTNREHVKHVRTIVAEKENHNGKACPKCGSPMVIRETKTGQNIGKKFWGCSNFPKCRSIVSVT
ncbi:MAG: topoisomerase DNA-binding C4 zinc finger domain-containing protein [Deltaproteobacteria bacterium]|nr:topoisomerase DNA-binding C4 zinc finger domain-containing protein [Deltaproteobacteria bacterium]